ncbi:MAG: InlB B-repeat-containing protein [Actinomycetota bacterium]
MRRFFAIGSVVAIAATLIASLSATPVPASESAASSQGVPADRPARGLVYRGLRYNPSGPCGELFQVGRSDGGPVVCTHGPDPAPAGVDVRTREPDLSGGSRRAADAGPTAPIPCIDGGTSGPRVHAIYAVASDVTDRFNDVVLDIRRWAEAVEGVVEQSAAETGGARGIRWITQSTGAATCELVVDHVVMPPEGDDSFANTIAALRAQGYIRPDRRYLAWVDADVLCGIGGLAEDDKAGIANINNGRVALYSRVDKGCWGLLDQFTSGPNFNSVEAHELMHNFGAVQSSAPHNTGGATGTGAGGHCTDEWDAMCYDDDSNPETFPLTFDPNCPESHGPLLDCNHDDYFHTAPPAGSYLDTNWNSADAIFFTGSPFPITRNLTVTRSGVGTGKVVGEVFGTKEACDQAGGNCPWVDEAGDVGIDCGQSCRAVETTNMPISLVATPAAGSDFGKWTGDCFGIEEGTDAQGNEQSVCHIRMSKAQTVNARFARPSPQPDLHVALKGKTSVGDDVYNSTGAKQSKAATVKRGKSATFEISLENDSSTTQDIRLKGPGSSNGFTVTYFSGNTDVTSAMVNGLITVDNVPPNASLSPPIKVVVKAKSAKSGHKKAVKVVATSGSKVDAVKATVKVS